jgi:eukaryotic-like serine/threonine-protein kinase
MTLASGTHIGSYEVVAAIGAGGMGEVYRTRDGKLGRDVAIKVLPATFAGDAERISRFQREAKVLASLDHPNIASIYGLEESGGTRALVMQLVEGPTLADRIKQGPFANYDVSPDGQRFLMLKPVEQDQAALTLINLVLNWTEELKRLVPIEK